MHELAMLPGSEIKELPCSQAVKDEVLSAKRLKGGSKKRQLKYATKLLRDEPVEDLYDFLARRKGSLLKKNREFHELEHFRNLLITEAVQVYEEMMHDSGYMNENEPIDMLKNSQAIAAITEFVPDVDCELLKNTAMQFARTRNRKFSRELFRILKAALEKIQYSQIKEKDNGI